LVLGTASGIAAAEFSGLGRGYDGFTSRYARGLAIAVAAVVAFYLGIYLIGQIDDATAAAFLSVGWGLGVLAGLRLLMRSVLHTGLLEAALESAARNDGVGATGELDFCAQCEMPLMPQAAFCTACGAAVRLQGAKPHRVATPAAAPAGAGGAAVAVAEQPDEPTRPMEVPLTGQQPSAPAPLGEPAPGPPDSLDRGDWSDGDRDEHQGRWDAAGGQREQGEEQP